MISCKQKTSEKVSKEEQIPSIYVSYVDEYPHDTNAFTEGLLFQNGELFESTGATDLLQTRSLFGIVDLSTGDIDVKVELDREKFFGEGIVMRHFQLL